MGSAQSQQASQDEGPRESVTWHPLELEEHAIDATPKLKVIVVGAGITGINAAILLPVKVPGIDLTIYERNAEVVSLPGSFANADADYIARAEYGTSAPIPEFDAMFLLTFTNRHFPLH